MSEKPIAAPEAELQEADQAKLYLNYFLQEACTPDEQGHVPDEVIRATVESVLLLHSGNLAANGSPDYVDRDKAVRKIQDEKAGMPKSRAEVTDIEENPLKRFNKALRRKKGRRSTYQRIHGYQDDALKESRTLTQVMTVTDEGKIVPDINNFRHSPGAIYTVADYLRARQSLDKMEWPAKNTNAYKDSQQYWRGCMVAAARFAGPSTLAVIVDDAREKVTDRLSYMRAQTQSIDETVGGKAVKAALDAELQTKDKNKEQGNELRQQPDKSEFSTESYIPEEHRRWLEERHRLYAEMVEHLDHAGMPQAEKQAVLEREFPEFTSVAKSTYLEVQEQLRINALRAQAGGTHPTGPRGKQRFFDNDNARADSDREQP